MSDDTPTSPEAGEPSRSGTAPYELSDFERVALVEVGEVCMTAAAGVLEEMLGRPVGITAPAVDLLSDAALREQFDGPSAVVEVAYSGVVEGSSILVLDIPDASALASALTGTEAGAPDQLDEAQCSAICEAMDRMMGAAAVAMSEMTGRDIRIAATGVDIVDLAQGGAPGMSGPSNLLVRAASPFQVEGLIDAFLLQVMPVGFARQLLDRASARPAPATEPEVIDVVEAEVVTPVEAEAPPEGESDEERHLRSVPGTTPVARPVTFPTLEDSSEAPGSGDIALLLDVPLQVTVELGRTQLRIRNVLELVPGSIVELDKLAGEPVDVLVNGKQIARGEVVVIDEEFGVRITDVASQAKRLHGLAVDEA